MIGVADPLNVVPAAPWTGLRADILAMLQRVEARFGLAEGNREIIAVIAGQEIVSCVDASLRFTIHVETWNPTDQRQALFQLAHEVFHVLSQKPDIGATYLEEGLAVVFQQYLDSARYGAPPLGATGKHEVARSTVQELLDLDPDIIRTIRATEPTVSQITAAHIRAACPQCSSELANRLVALF